MQLSEATLQDICQELSQRNLSFTIMAQYYSGTPEDTMPYFSFGVRREDICHMIGLTDIAKNQLIEEFKSITSIVEEKDLRNDDENLT